jgi:hypothetical protein
VPQANNLCTQFPLEINLIRTSEHSVDWNCRISIEHSYEFIPADIGEKPTENQSMPPGKQLPKAPTFHVTETHGHNAVCELISEAQTKILAALLSVVVPHKYKIKFSPNAIKLDIIRHDIPDLSFVNLPGVITTNLDESFVGLVENLVTMYAKSPQSINILTLPMTDESANSTALYNQGSQGNESHIRGHDKSRSGSRGSRSATVPQHAQRGRRCATRLWVSHHGDESRYDFDPRKSLTERGEVLQESGLEGSRPEYQSRLGVKNLSGTLSTATGRDVKWSSILSAEI